MNREIIHDQIVALRFILAKEKISSKVEAEIVLIISNLYIVYNNL